MCIEELGNIDDALADFFGGHLNRSSAIRLVCPAVTRPNQEGNFTDALSDLQFAKRFDPKNARIELYLSRIYQKLGQSNAALDSVNDALALRPRYADAFAHRAALLAANAPDKAVADYEAAINSTSYRQDRFYLKIGNIRWPERP